VADDREPLGRIVRETWVAWALEQPDVGDHPSWVKPWTDLPGRDKEVDMRIGSAVAARALADWEAERAELTMARLSRSVKLARIAALCRAKPDRVCAEDVLRIIGTETQERSDDKEAGAS
jgi:hypothetical protein